MKSWHVTGTQGLDSLELHDAPVPEARGDQEVLVKFEYASLNFRDALIPQGQYPFGFRDNVVPGSDGAGIVVKTGKHATKFQTGTRVLVQLNQEHLYGSLTTKSVASGVGGTIDGTFREYGVYQEHGLVEAPKNLNAAQASTLACAGLTAWNCLFGLAGHKLQPGEWVLTQGSGGVSTFAIQFAKMVGARVIATTSSQSKAETLKSLGADYVIDYKKTPNWGAEAKKLTGDRAGVDHIVEVGGPGTITQSLEAIRIHGVISIVGFLDQAAVQAQPTFLDCLMKVCTVRGIVTGSRELFEDMVRAVEANKCRPVIDSRQFDLDHLKDAYQYMMDGKHVGKICIKVSQS